MSVTMKFPNVLALLLALETFQLASLWAQTQEKFSDYFFFKKSISLNADSQAPLASPCPCAVTRSGDVFLGDKISATVRKYDKKNGFVFAFGGKGSGPGEFRSIFSLAVDTSIIYILDPMGRRVNWFDHYGTFISSFTIVDGRDLRIASSGEIIIAAPLVESSAQTSCIQVFSKTGKLIRSFFPIEPIVLKNKLLADNVAFDIDSKDNIYACQESRYRILKYNLHGKLLRVIEPTNRLFRPIPSKPFEDHYSKQAIVSWFASWHQVVGLRVIADRIILVVLHTTAPRKFMIDILDAEGKMLRSGILTDLQLLCTDPEGKLYFLRRNEKEGDIDFILEQYMLTPRLLSAVRKD